MIRFELLKPDMIDELHCLELECFKDEAWTRGMFESELNNAVSVFPVGVDEENGKIVCYGCIWLIADSAEITNVAVAPKYRRTGLGLELLKIMEAICRERGISLINLEVKDGNTAAENLYTKFGFDKVGSRRNYYKDGSAAILMTKTLV